MQTENKTENSRHPSPGPDHVNLSGGFEVKPDPAAILEPEPIIVEPIAPSGNAEEPKP